MMEKLSIDICLCTGGSAQTKDLLLEQLFPITQGDLYLKYSDSELANTSADFRQISIPDIPISTLRNAARNLGLTSPAFKKRIENHSSKSPCARRSVSAVSNKFSALFENEVNSTAEIGLARDAVSDSITASRILYHLGNDIPKPYEGELWNSLCCLIDPHRTTFELTMIMFLDCALTIEEMAGKMHLSLTGFKNKFAEYMGGKTPHNWIITQLLHRAHIDVVTTDYSISEIARRNHFDNVSHFIKLFKREFGKTPLKFRTPALHTR